MGKPHHVLIDYGTAVPGYSSLDFAAVAVAAAEAASVAAVAAAEVGDSPSVAVVATG
jgi:hypothetical protein